MQSFQIDPPDEATIKTQLGDWGFVERYINDSVATGNTASLCQMVALYANYLNSYRDKDVAMMTAAKETGTGALLLIAYFSDLTGYLTR